MSVKKTQFNKDQILKEEQIILDCYSNKNSSVILTLFKLYKGNYKNLLLGVYSKGQFFRRIWHSPFGLCLFPLFKRISAAFLAFLPLQQSVLLR